MSAAAAMTAEQAAQPESWPLLRRLLCRRRRPVAEEPAQAPGLPEKDAAQAPVLPDKDAPSREEAPSSDEEGTALASTDLASHAASDVDAEADDDVACGADGVDDGRCRVRVVCDCTKPGDRLAILGGDEALGAWDVERAVLLATSPDAFPTWSAEVPAPAPAPGSEYKLAIVGSDGGVSWEPIHGNRAWPSGPTSGTTLATYGRLD